MSEYISRDAIHAKIEKLERYFDDPAPTDGYYLVEDVLSEIENFTAADVAPVIHARWIASYAEGETFEGYTEKFIDSFQCSSCGNYAVPDSPYCPHCGAKMENAGNIGAP